MSRWETLFDQWGELKENLAVNWEFDITPDTSSIFIVNHFSDIFPEQVGALIGTSGAGWFDESGGEVSMANASSSTIVAEASQAILAQYGSWEADGLFKDEVFYFSSREMKTGKLKRCHPAEGIKELRDCVQVATHSMSLDKYVRWLVVVVLPSEAYFTAYNQQVTETNSGIDLAQSNASSTLNTTNIVCIVIIVFAVVIALTVASITSCLVLNPLLRLGVLMGKLSNLDFARDSPEYLKLQRGVRGRVREVNVLREGFCRLSRSIETFAKFVPETVVKNLVSPDENTRKRATQLHVTKRNVTIMFSDIKDFTTITESLAQKDLLFVLTLYLTVMTRIIESFDGVVGEVLGDGLLCFWNTVGAEVEQHAAKACLAALAQQQALGSLNAELAKRNLPELQIRIGLHKGDVLTGNIGSEQKMKFGCMGDPVNLASRLEGLCKVYDVGIMCSGTLCDALPESFNFKSDDQHIDIGFVTRRLDKVQVKGKKDPTTIFELIGLDCPLKQWGIEPVSPTTRQQALMYEEALDAYQTAKFAEAASLIETLHKQRPDGAVTNLLERAKKYVDRESATASTASPREGFSAFWQFFNMSNRTPISAEDHAAWTGVEKMMDK